MKKILITGKTGTVGSNLHFGYGFSSKEVDLRNKQATNSLIKKELPSAIVHCAADVGGLKYHLEQRYNLYYNNVAINTNLIDAAKKYSIPRVLSYLSSCIYSDASPPPYTEKMLHDGEPVTIHYPYGYAKRMLEVHSRICYQEFGLKYNCIVPTNIYGINDDFSFERGHVVAMLIRRAYEAATSGSDFIVWGDGKQIRDFIFTEDIARLTEWALYNYFECEPLIFSNSIPIEIGDIARLIARKFNIENKIVFDVSKPSGQIARSLSGNKLSSLLNFHFTSIEDGISKSVDWFIKNYPYVRI